MQQPLRVDTVDVQLMAGRWGVSASELNGTGVPAGLGLSCQAGATSVAAAHAEVAAFTAAFATRVNTRAAHVIQADTSYITNEAYSANQLAVVGSPATGV